MLNSHSVLVVNPRPNLRYFSYFLIICLHPSYWSHCFHSFPFVLYKIYTGIPMQNIWLISRRDEGCHSMFSFWHGFFEVSVYGSVGWQTLPVPTFIQRFTAQNSYYSVTEVRSSTPFRKVVKNSPRRIVSSRSLYNIHEKSRRLIVGRTWNLETPAMTHDVSSTISLQLLAAAMFQSHL